MNIQDASTWQILIIDDEPDNLEVVAESLQFFGASVKIASNGEEGLKALEAFMPSFILLDLSMPVMDGWEMRSRVKANPKTKHIPVIALSAHAMAGDKERAMNAGFDGYMTKPINIPTLLKDLQEVIQSVKPDASIASTDASATTSSEASATTSTDTSASVSTDVSTDANSDARSDISTDTNADASTGVTSSANGNTGSNTNVSAEAGRATS